MKNFPKIIEFPLFILIICFLIMAYSCKSLVVKEEDSASDKAGKVFGRVLLGVGTLGMSEEYIKDYGKEYEQKKQAGTILRNYSLHTLLAIEDIGKAEEQIALMTRANNEDRIKYHLVMANNLLDNAVDKMKELKSKGNQKDIAKRFKSTIEDIVNKKKQLIKYWMKKERGAALAYQNLANEEIVKLLDGILSLGISNEYVFSQDDTYKIIAIRERWAQLTKSKLLKQPSPKQTF